MLNTDYSSYNEGTLAARFKELSFMGGTVTRTRNMVAYEKVFSFFFLFLLLTFFFQGRIIEYLMNVWGGSFRQNIGSLEDHLGSPMSRTAAQRLLRWFVFFFYFFRPVVFSSFFFFKRYLLVRVYPRLLAVEIGWTTLVEEWKDVSDLLHGQENVDLLTELKKPILPSHLGLEVIAAPFEPLPEQVLGDQTKWQFPKAHGDPEISDSLVKGWDDKYNLEAAGILLKKFEPVKFVGDTIVQIMKFAQETGDLNAAFQAMSGVDVEVLAQQHLAEVQQNRQQHSEAVAQMMANMEKAAHMTNVNKQHVEALLATTDPKVCPFPLFFSSFFFSHKAFSN